MIDAAHKHFTSGHPDCPDCHQPLPRGGVKLCPYCGHDLAAARVAPRPRNHRRLLAWLLSLVLLAGATALFGWQLAQWLGHPVQPRNNVVAAASSERDAPEPLAPTGAEVHPTLSQLRDEPPAAPHPALALAGGGAAEEARHEAATVTAVVHEPQEDDVAAAPPPAEPVASPAPRRKAPALAAAVEPKRLPAPRTVVPVDAGVPNEALFLMQQQTMPVARDAGD
ncbi:hypothetical protein EV683_106125 [Crenobacter luteus]|uniref:hypothetical protein n=1 Tax=Crenobacter luteus TaxID=1452487 RepID=UPI00104E5A49|nr:hypothetical protein [Crenobacter luteus]TCP13688.1 hypothetical protein EV683_106125 [Crenobacter luteus]